MIDTHVHIWDPERVRYTWLDGEGPILNRAYGIQQWEQATSGTPVTSGVLVQAANSLEDTYLMLEAAGTCPMIKGVVGWLPLQHPDAVAALLEGDFGKNPMIKGIRHLIHNESDPQWLLQPAVIESLKMLAAKGLTYDLVGILPAHIKTALAVAQKVPDLVMVFDHLNQPPIAQGEKFGEWGEWMAEAARHEGFYCKISGLGNPSGKPFRWTADDIEPYVDFVLHHFGEGRCFCGGDWPVSLLTGNYADTVRNYELVLTRLLGHEALKKVFIENASTFYKLKTG
jgi:L-fuconolactonase